MRYILNWAEMIKIEHTVFSMPFMLSILLIAEPSQIFNWTVLFWSAIALFGARSAAMTFNRLIDAPIDAKNPRTAGRAIPKGIISKPKALIFGIAGLIIMLFAAWQLNLKCLLLSPFAIIGLVSYSYFKRFSIFTHYYLGLVVAGAVLGGWVASTGILLAWLPWLIAIGVGFWIAGFDILYAMQDIEHDRESGLHSIPAKFGIHNSLWISRFSHIASWIFFAIAAWLIPIGLVTAYMLAIGILGFGLIYEQYLISKDLTNIPKAFFQANAIIAGLFFITLFVGKLILIS